MCKFIWSVIWRLAALIVAIVVFIFISKVNGFSMVATALFSVIELIGFYLFLKQIIHKNWKKYFPNSKGKVNDEDSYS